MVDKFDIFVLMILVKEIGGDFYDYFMVGECKFGFVIGDVCGKGMLVVMFMSVLCMILKIFVWEGFFLGLVFIWLNVVLVDDNFECMFVMLFYGCFDLDIGEFVYFSVGYEDVYYLLLGVFCWCIESFGFIVGVFEGMEFLLRLLLFWVGDSFVLVIDGIIEVFDVVGNLFGV